MGRKAKSWAECEALGLCWQYMASKAHTGGMRRFRCATGGGYTPATTATSGTHTELSEMPLWRHVSLDNSYLGKMRGLAPSSESGAPPPLPPLSRKMHAYEF